MKGRTPVKNSFARITKFRSNRNNNRRLAVWQIQTQGKRWRRREGEKKRKTERRKERDRNREKERKIKRKKEIKGEKKTL